MTCVHVCPYRAPHVGDDGKAVIQGAVCMGCGSCTAECPAKAITLRHYVDAQILAAVDSLLRTPASGPRESSFLEEVGVAKPRWHPAPPKSAAEKD
jgi:Fe-S-cluster-containing dehydrogenase component